ncbi:prepilin-type N-terminal cleavage/methylation domain-containing protein [Shewanella sp. WXL01]|uniref:Prepilin-type N-terminal cleavage/methylation domain-containing protein n=1 Tax=Shewanella maritima TaxID=2520507 RepID=A0A411PFJ4_9GAMM|nr:MULTISPECIES: prepilin-type N-terminal cleavage/methylation domain-containing protein [Shewanella]NKF49578.1 prepilin-type N-terminal cleavage/methylation domain-containing protein [Shewanella sp. WXL01]QBF82323.1 prepilin-type N-terminal cleavage/methylation domain-containing protein [Shewanella maritima]
MKNNLCKSDNIRKVQQGFTLVELIVVIIILAILAIVAAPKFIGLSSEARTSILSSISASVKTANSLVYAKSQMPSLQVQPVSGRDDLIDIDLDNDGIFETRLKWGYLDNTDIEKWIELDDAFTIQYQGIANTYIGYDLDKNGQTLNDNCYFHYVQAANATTPPQLSIEASGC